MALEQKRGFRGLIWNKCLNLETQTVKILGIHFSYNKELMNNKNFLTIIKKIESTLIPWSKRLLTLEGRILVFKTLAFSKIVYISYLTDLPPGIIDQLHSIQSKFVWQGKKSKIKHVTLIGDYSEGGLKNIDIQAKMSSLRLAWIRRIFNNSFHPYKVIPLHLFSFLKENGYLFFPNINFQSIEISNYPKFYINLLKEWTQNAKKEPKLPSIALSEHLWQNSFINIDYKQIFFKDFKVKGINFVIDLFNANGNLYSWLEFKNKYLLHDCLFLKWYQLCHAIPEQWKSMIKIDSGRCFQNIFLDQHLTFGGRMLSISMLDSKTLYSIQVKKIFKAPTSQPVLDNLFPNSVLDWSTIYLVARKVTLDTYTRVFHYKVVNNILFLNQKLFKINKSITDKCSYCSFSVENVKHLFSQCLVTKWLWSEVQRFFNCKIIIPNLSIESAYFGFVNVQNNVYIFLNHLLLIFKIYVYTNDSTIISSLISFIKLYQSRFLKESRLNKIQITQIFTVNSSKLY